jgi:sugar O-acyltransferase (sialic acid O-acetyltransferase NeuD family)
MSDSNTLHLIGAGGHAKVVIRALQDLGHNIAAIFDDDLQRQGGFLRGIPIIVPIERICEYPRRPTVVAVGDNAKRRNIAKQYDLPWMTIVHPQAFVDVSVHLGRGTLVLPHAVVQVDSFLGEHVIVNTAATIDHDCSIGDYTHIAPGAHLAGGIKIGSEVLFGIGAVALPDTMIGDGVTVGAGAVVIRNLPDYTTAVGIPAKIIRSLQHSPNFKTAPLPAADSTPMDLFVNNIFRHT